MENISISDNSCIDIDSSNSYVYIAIYI